MDRLQESKARTHIYDLIGRMAKKIGVDIPTDRYPKITFEPDTPYRDPLDNRINLPQGDIDSSKVIGEEAGQFIRDWIVQEQRRASQKIGVGEYLLASLGVKKLKPSPKPAKKEIQVEEFFGYLGRKILEEVAKPEDRLQSKTIAKHTVKDRRRHKLEHARPYKFAEALDLSQVDYKELYSLPDQEVRHRFFRADPQYDLTQPPKPGKVTKRKSKQPSLEKTVGLIIISTTLILLITLITRTITGFTISNNPSNTNWIAILLVIFVIVILHKNLKDKIS